MSVIVKCVTNEKPFNSLKLSPRFLTLFYSEGKFFFFLILHIVIAFPSSVVNINRICFSSVGKNLFRNLWQVLKGLYFLLIYGIGLPRSIVSLYICQCIGPSQCQGIAI